MKTTDMEAKMSSFRMDAYYYGFSSTGEEIVDLILSAVACAGKAYHHTDQWLEPTEPWHEKLRGSSPAEWIQRAAEDVAGRIHELRHSMERLERANTAALQLIDSMFRDARTPTAAFSLVDLQKIAVVLEDKS